MTTGRPYESKIGAVIQALEIGRLAARDKGQRSAQLLAESQLKYYRQLRSARDEGRSIVAHSFTEPAELFTAMDIVPLPVEYICPTVCHLAGGVAEAFSAASSFGFRSDICSYDRLLSGAFLLEYLPPPDAFVSTSAACDGAMPRGDVALQLFDCPAFNLDLPYHLGQSDFRYYTEQMRELVRFLEELTGRKLDLDRLGEAVQLMRREFELIAEIVNLRKAVPCPISGRFWRNLVMMDGCMAGTPELVSYLEAVRDEARGMVERKKGAAKDERHRLLTVFGPPTYVAPDLYEWMADRHGAVSVTDTGTIWGDLDLTITDPIEAVANKVFNESVIVTMHIAAADFHIPRIIRDIADYQVDGAVIWPMTGCPMMCAQVRVIRDVIRDNGLPCAVIETDWTDPTFMGEAEIKGKLEEFFERLDAEG
jgi:benzoyl-CoA reductase/2-hydroxyglutaryl-CoA dehydratase subunit BcrC/BadD/HgdB